MSNQKNQNHTDTDTKQTVSERDLGILRMAEAISDQDERNYVLMTQVYEDGYLQRQLAEECSELAQAALKLIRVWNDETPEDEQTAISMYIEELADVWVMLSMALQELDADEMQYCTDICQYKRERLHDRLCDAATQGRGDYAKTAEDNGDQGDTDGDGDGDADQDDVWDRLDEAWADMDEALTQARAAHVQDAQQQGRHGNKAALKMAVRRMLDRMSSDEFQQAVMEALQSGGEDDE